MIIGDIFKENEFIELKNSFSDSIIESLVAFSNFKGGRVIIGIDEKRKKINNIKLNDETIQNWLNEIKNKTQPYIIPDISFKIIDGKTIVIFDIISFPLKPVSFKGKYYIRKHNSNHQMSVSEVSDMYLKTKRSSWDYYIWDNFKYDDLDENKIKIVMFMIEKNLNIDLVNINNFLNKYDLIIDNNKITNAAVLLFAKQTRRETDIQIGLFQDDITIKKNRIIRNDLISQVNETIDFIKAYILKEFIITGYPQREERWQYPLEVIRELVINAIIHRDYRGVHSQFKIFPYKLELWNSGELPFDLSINDIIDGNKRSEPRNRLIAEIFRDCGLIERYGSGVSRARKIILDYGLPDIKINTMQRGLNVEIFSKDYEVITKKKPPQKITPQKKTPQKKTPQKKTPQKKTTNNFKLTKLEIGILNIIEKNPSIIRNDIALKLNLSSETIKEYLERLKSKRVLFRKGGRRFGYWEVILK